MKKKYEFSKIIMLVVAITGLYIIAFSSYMIYRTNDTSVFAYLIPAIFVEIGTATAFYYKKAERENIKKIERGHTNE